MRRRSNRLRYVTTFLIAIGLALTAANQTYAAQNTPIQIRRFEPPDVEALATSLVRKWLRDNHSLTPPGWSGRLLDLVDAAEVVPDDANYVLLFLQMGVGDACGTAGCETYVYRKTPKGYVRLCAAMMYEDIVLLDAKENGYHLIDAGEIIIHWSKQRNKNTGDLCYTESKPGYD